MRRFDRGFGFKSGPGGNEGKAAEPDCEQARSPLRRKGLDHQTITPFSERKGGLRAYVEVSLLPNTSWYKDFRYLDRETKS
jgi:hypothetical protein